jgi:hypothetical protein
MAARLPESVKAQESLKNVSGCAEPGDGLEKPV